MPYQVSLIAAANIESFFLFSRIFQQFFRKKNFFFSHLNDAAYTQLLSRNTFQKKLTAGFKAVVAHSKSGKKKPARSGRTPGDRFFHSVVTTILLEYSFKLSGFEYFAHCCEINFKYQESDFTRWDGSGLISAAISASLLFFFLILLLIMRK